MLLNDALPQASELGSQVDFLRKIDRRMERENRRMHANLTAWAEILDALGWKVAIWLSDGGPVLGSKAREWISALAAAPHSGGELCKLLESMPSTRYLVRSMHVQVWADSARESASSGLPIPLTKREAEVFAWLREGKTGPEIAVILGCAQRTVESHVARLYRKLGIHNRARLMFESQTAVTRPRS